VPLHPSFSSKSALVPVLTLGSLAMVAAGAGLTHSAPLAGAHPLAAQRASAAALKLPLTFEENGGQAGRAARFLSRGPGYTLALSSTGAVVSLTRRQSPGGSRQSPTPATLRLRVLGGNPTARMAGVARQRGMVNYFLGNDPKQWRTHVPTFAKVRYEGVYPGIDLVYHGTQGSLEYDFEVAPGADPRQIRVAASGAEKVELAKNGDLLLHTATGTVTQHKPVAYQVISGEKQQIAAEFVLGDQTTLGSSSRQPDSDPTDDRSHIRDHDTQSAIRNPQSAILGFRLARYDASQPLIIDPILAFSSYLGGSADDQAQRIVVDSNDCAYIVGRTQSTDIDTEAPYDASNAGADDVFVGKLSADASYFVYSTYIGGAGTDVGMGIAVDSSGNAYIGGYTSSTDYPTTSGAYDTSQNGSNDVVVTKLSADGSALTYSTYIGGSGDDRGNGIAVNSSGAAYLTGRASSSYPRVNPFDNVYGNVGNGGSSDAFATKLATDGASLTYSTFLGGTNTDIGNAIAVDSGGNAYLTGWTLSSSMPIQNSWDASQNGSHDAWVIKVNSAGNTLGYSTYLGGSASDFGNGIAVTSAGVTYVTGSTDSSNFPTASPYQASKASGTDVFVASFSATGSTLAYSTFLGGASTDSGNEITIRSDGSIYLTGKTSSSDFPNLNAFQSSLSGSQDAFVTRIASGGASLEYSSFLGGTSTEEGLGIAVDSSGNTLVAGLTVSDDLPLVAELDDTRAGNEGFIARIEPGFFAPTGLTVAEGTNGKPKLSWNDNCDGETGYSVERRRPDSSFAEVFTAAANQHTNVEDTTATAGYSYVYQVRAYDATRTTDYTDEATFTPAAPAAASGVTASLDGTGAVVQISWTDNSSSEISFLLQRSLNDTDWTTASSLAAGTTTATDSSLQDGATTLYYRIVAENEGGSTPSASAGLPLAPTNLAVTEGASGKPVLSWNDNTLDETGFRIERSAAGDLTTWAEVLTSGANEHTNVEDTTAVAGTSYGYRVRAARPGCYTGYSGQIVFTPTAPTAPTNLTAALNAAGSAVGLSWADASNNELTFNVERSTDGGVMWNVVSTVAANSTTASDSDVAGRTVIHYRVVAVNEGGSNTSTEALGYVAPTGLTAAEGTNAKPVLSWDDNFTDETGYSIERQTVSTLDGFTAVLDASANQTTSVEDTTATPGIRYEYRVRAIRPSSSTGYSATVVFTPSAPDAPSDLTAQTSASGTSVSLAWTDNSNNETQVVIWRTADGGLTFDPVLFATPPVTSATDNTADPDTSYYYQVIVYNDGGSGAGPIVAASPRQPSGLTAEAVSGTAIELSWTDNSWNEAGFELERQVDSGSFMLLADLDAGTRVYRHTGLASNTTYTYRLRSYGETASGWTDPASATTFSGAPEAPGSLKVHSPDRGSVVLTWMDSSDDESGFKIYRQVGISGAYSLLTTRPADTNTYTDASTTGDTRYSYTVVAYNDRGVSPSTKEQSVTTLWGPESLTASAVTTAQIDLTFKDMTLYEDGYSIERRKGSGSYVEAARVSGKVGKNQTLTYSDTGLTSGVSYTYRVRAYNTNATSLYGTASSITTTDAPDPSLRVTPTSKSYGGVPRGQARTAVFTVKNAGKKPEQVTVAALGGSFEVLGTRHFALPAGASRTFKVRFTARKPGAYRAGLPVKCQHGEVVKLKLDGRSVRG
jgi:hypothetical protein